MKDQLFLTQKFQSQDRLARQRARVERNLLELQTESPSLAILADVIVAAQQFREDPGLDELVVKAEEK